MASSIRKVPIPSTSAVYVRLCAQVVNFVRLNFFNYPGEIRAVCEVAIVEPKLGTLRIWRLIDVIYALRIERRCPTLNSMNFVAVLQKELG